MKLVIGVNVGSGGYGKNSYIAVLFSACVGLFNGDERHRRIAQQCCLPSDVQIVLCPRRTAPNYFFSSNYLFLHPSTTTALYVDAARRALPVSVCTAHTVASEARETGRTRLIAEPLTRDFQVVVHVGYTMWYMERSTKKHTSCLPHHTVRVVYVRRAAFQEHSFLPPNTHRL